MNSKINWGILNTGAIATCFARNLAASQTGRLLAVSSRQRGKAAKFAADFKAERAYGSYDELLADKDVQAVYISPPHPFHAEWAIKAIKAGKHVLVEKPIALNQYEAMAMVEAAMAHKVLLMEAFMYRCHPQTAKLVELIKAGAIGQVRMIRASFGWQGAFNADSRVYQNELAGGGIMDVGCYTASIARLIAGASAGKPFADPTHVCGAGHLGQTGVDEWAIASLKFPCDIVAQLSTAVSVNQDNTVTIWGSEGQIDLPNPWVANREKAENGKIILRKNGKPPEEIIAEATVTSFTYEADVFGNALLAGQTQAPAPAMSWEDSMGNIATLDRWRQAIGLTFDSEKPENLKPVTVAGVPLKVRSDAEIPSGSIPGLNKKVSRLVMGVDNQDRMPHAAVVFDDFFEKGGNTFDTGWVYGALRSKLLGQWVKTRGVREQVNLIVKGAHTPECNPKALTRQLLGSLKLLQTDYADIYMMHRDNLDIPVGEFVDVLNEHAAAGRIKVFGGSNWSIERVEAANAYAKKKGLRGFNVISNNFSLARMVNPVWDGCIAASDPQSKAWLTAHKDEIALLPWSSQARGFFVPGVASPDKKDDAEMVNAWYSPENFERQRRAFELAKEKGVAPINIALAYVLCQPFPIFPLIGPRKLSETRTSLPALSIHLSEKEMKWLDLVE